MRDLVLVVGGTRGTGLLIAELLARRGHGVRVLARDPDDARRRLGAAIEVAAGDITEPTTLPAAVDGVDAIVFTAGAPSGRYAPEDLVRRTDHDGVLNVLAAARDTGFAGRFLYLNSMGVLTPSFAGRFINLLKRNTLAWRRKVEDEIRKSGVDYTIIRVPFLVNATGNRRAVVVGQGALPLSPRYRIGRSDAAECFAAALGSEVTRRTTFEIVWDKGVQITDWETQFVRLLPDGEQGQARRKKPAAPSGAAGS